jgi:hypothetical protein
MGGFNPNRKGGDKIKRICLVVFLCLFVFSGQAMAYMVGQFETEGTISLSQEGNFGELFLHTGGPFQPGIIYFIEKEV